MSTLPESADRIRCVSDMMAVRTDWKSELEAIAAELRQQPQPVNTELLAAMRDIVAFNTERFSDGPVLQRCRLAIARAESLEKVPDALTLSHEIQAKRGFSLGVFSAPAQPDVVSGLANSLRESIKIAASQIGEHYSAGIIYECGTGSLPIVKHVIANIILAQTSAALAAYEAKSKAEPKA